MKRNCNAASLKTSILCFMKTRNIWVDELHEEIPKSWEKYGDLILFSEPFFRHPLWLQAGTQLLELICDKLQCTRIAVKGPIQNDAFRSPKSKLIFGDSSVVHFVDNKIKYSWDIEKSMFCAGNVSERHRIAKLDCRNEIVVDLFAGIGYFSLPYLLHAKVKFLHACEWNPNAVLALRENLRLNKLEDMCEIHEGDCTKVCPVNVANRVNLGLIPSSEFAWPTACKALVPSGGILHVHETVTTKLFHLDCEQCSEICRVLNIKQCFPLVFPIEFSKGKQTLTYGFLVDEELLVWKKMEWFVYSIHIAHKIAHLLENLHNEKWCIKIKNVNKVKSYAPHIDHLVFTVHCYPKRT